MEKIAEIYERWRSDYKRLWELAPEIQKTFNNLHMSTHKDGVLSIKIKELVAIGISVAIQCVPCIAIHTKLALDAGATRDEIVEASAMAVILTGGSGAAYIGRVFESIDTFSTKV